MTQSKTYEITHATILGILRDLKETTDPDDCVAGNAVHRIETRLNGLKQLSGTSFEQEEQSRSEKVSKALTSSPVDPIQEAIDEDNQARKETPGVPGILTSDLPVKE